VWVEELAVVVDLASEIGVILLGRLEDDLKRSVVVTVCGRERQTFEPLMSLCEAR
jgi:hypothetical protein